MAGSAQSSGNSRPIWIAVAALLLIGIVVPLLVGLYDQETPTLFGFPFYYWFQFMLIPIVSGLTFIAFKLSEVGTARDRKRRGQTRSSDRKDERP